ncbi:MAG: hypothetical protein ACKOUR_09420, partial [Planctomycetota bacterium]
MKIWGWKWLAFTVLAWSLTVVPVSAQGRGGPGMGMMRGGAGGGVLMLALAEPVQKELGLSPEAIEKVQKVSTSAREELQAAMAGFAQGGFQNLSDEQRQEMMTKMQDTNRKMQEKYLPKMQEVLTPEQFQRLKQIGWQMAGAGALSDPEVAKELKISSEQTAAAKKVGDEFSAKQRTMMQEAFQGGGPNPELM